MLLEIIGFKNPAAVKPVVTRVAGRVLYPRSSSRNLSECKGSLHTGKSDRFAEGALRSRSGPSGLQDHPALRDLRSGPSGFEARRRDEG